MKAQVLRRGTTPDGIPVYLIQTEAGNTAEITLMGDTAPEVFKALDRAAYHRRAMEINVVDLATFRRVGVRA
jgi:hypothetical protein